MREHRTLRNTRRAAGVLQECDVIVIERRRRVRVEAPLPQHRLESHVTWQIRTFWYELAFQVVGWITVWILIGWAILSLGVLFFIWRIAKGWVRLANRRPVENPDSFL